MKTLCSFEGATKQMCYYHCLQHLAISTARTEVSSTLLSVKFLFSFFFQISRPFHLSSNMLYLISCCSPGLELPQNVSLYAVKIPFYLLNPLTLIARFRAKTQVIKNELGFLATLKNRLPYQLLPTMPGKPVKARKGNRPNLVNSGKEMIFFQLVDHIQHSVQTL